MSKRSKRQAFYARRHQRRLVRAMYKGIAEISRELVGCAVTLVSFDEIAKIDVEAWKAIKTRNKRNTT